MGKQRFEDNTAAALHSTLEYENVFGINYDQELEGGTETFSIRPCIIVTEAGNYMPMYGVYNRNTGIRETEQRQYSAAITWAEVLTNAENEVARSLEEGYSVDGEETTIDLIESTETTH